MKYLPLLAILFLTACASGPGAAPEPPTSDSSTIDGGTANDMYHGGGR
jgi:hypothetical protein